MARSPSASIRWETLASLSAGLCAGDRQWCSAWLLVLAFENPADATTVVVVINSGSGTSASFFVSGASWPSQVTPWVTDASQDLIAQTAIPLAAARFTATIGAQSVTTFVGKP